jgi:F-type H+-transporting ATPase subunit b
MLVDWFTVGAQIVNFLVLMVLLKIFLYDRVVQAMDERQKKISSQLQDANRKKEEARKEAEDLNKKRRKLEAERDEIISEATRQAESRRRTLVENARNEVDQMQSRWRESIERRQQVFVKDLQKMACRQIYDAAGKALHDLADDDLEARILESFTNRIQHMDREGKEQLISGEGRLLVRSAFEIGSTERGKLTRFLHREVAKELEVDYQQDSELLGGVEIKAAGKKISWNLRDYLTTLEEKTVNALDRQAHRENADGQAETEKPSGEEKTGQA